MHILKEYYVARASSKPYIQKSRQHLAQALQKRLLTPTFNIANNHTYKTFNLSVGNSSVWNCSPHLWKIWVELHCPHL